MMTKTFDCLECGASAPYGRLSCPSCGALLASVTGGPRSAVRVAQVESDPKAEPERQAVPAASSVAVAQAPVVANPVKTTRKRASTESAPAPVPTEGTTAPTAGPSPTSVPTATPVAGRTPSYAPTPAAAARTRASAPQTEQTPAPMPTVTFATAAAATRTPTYAPSLAAAARTRSADPIPTPAPVPTAVEPEAASAPASQARSEAQRAAIVPLLEPSAIGTLPATPWAPIVEPAPTLVGRPYPRHLSAEPDPANGRVTPPSAYRPPSHAMALATTTAAANDANRESLSNEGPGAVGPEPTAGTGPKRWLDTFPDPARFVEIAGWFVVVGATMALLGFLLPWSRVVIGASTIGGYFDGWGLASPTHLFVFVALLAVLALAIRREPIPAWITSGIFGLVFGGLLLGLAWPYLIGPLGADVGLTMTFLGGVALLIGGVVALWATRHVVAEPLV